MQYLHCTWANLDPSCFFFNFIYLLNFLIFLKKIVLNVVAPPLVAIEGVHWAKDGPKFAYRVDGYDASYTAKYNLTQHL